MLYLFGDGLNWGHAGLVIACFAVYAAYRFKRRFDYFEERGFPTLPLGKTISLTFQLFTFRINLWDFMEAIYKHFDGHKVGGYYQMGSNNLLVRDPDLVNKILIKDFSYFHDHGFEVDTDVNPLEGHLFNMNGHQWKALRNKLAPTFTTGKLRGMLPQMSACSDNLIDLLRQSKPDEDVLVHDILSRFAIDVIGSCAFGIEAGALKDPDCEFRRMAKKIFRPSTRQLCRSLFRTVFPRLALKLKMKTMDDEVTDFFFGITRQAFEHRMKTGIKRNDFVDLLLQLKLKGSVDCDPKELTEEDIEVSHDSSHENCYQEESEKLELTDGLLAAQSFAFLVSGWESTASVISFTLYFLAKHPDAQDKARREVREARGEHGEFTYDALKKMVYLDACISESMRLYSQAVALIRSCAKSYTLDDGRVIDKGTSVWVPIAALQRDPAHFDDPEVFRPERFMLDNQIPSNAYLPFGDGPRICIARRFVLLEVKQMMSKLLDNLKFTTSPKTTEPIQLSRKSFIVEPEGGLWLRLEALEDTKII